jgi:hypothetical protein
VNSPIRFTRPGAQKVRALMLRSPYSNFWWDRGESREMLEYAHGEDQMKPIRLFIPFALALLVVSGCTGSNASKDKHKPSTTGSNWVINVSGDRAKCRIGRYHYLRAQGRQGHGDFAVAVEIFGKPTLYGRTFNLCNASWKNLGLLMSYVNAFEQCSAKGLVKKGWWYGARVSSKRWKTDRGLRVGDSERTLRSLYPKARFVRQSAGAGRWVLVHRRDHEFDLELLIAEVQKGRVTAIVTPADYIY